MITSILAWVVTIVYSMLLGGFVIDLNKFNWKEHGLSLTLMSLPIVLGMITILGGI